MAGQHGAGVPETLLAEKDMLVGSIVSGGGGGGAHDTTVEAVREFLIWLGNQGIIPFLRIYESFPDWQQQSGLLQENWDKNVVQERAKVIFTLITPLGQRSISRKAFGGGSWKSTGAEIIGQDEEVVLSKLYYKRDAGISPSPMAEFTAFEFRLKMKLQPKVAICVLHPKGYTGCIPDLKNDTLLGWFVGGYQASHQAFQPLPTFYTDSYAVGFMTGPHVAYTNNLAYNSETNILGANKVGQMAVQHEGQYSAPNDVGFLIGAQVDVTNPVPNNETCYGEPLIHSSLEAPPPPASFDDLSHFWFSENNSMDEFGGKHSHVDELLMLNDFCNTLNETTTTEPSLEPFPLWDNLL